MPYSIASARACNAEACAAQPVVAEAALGPVHMHCGTCNGLCSATVAFGVTFATCDVCKLVDVMAEVRYSLLEVVAGAATLPDALEVPQTTPAATPAAKPGRKPRASRKVPKEQLGLAW